MILVFATSRGVVTTAANPPVHIKPEHRAVYYMVLHRFYFIFPIILPKSLLYHYIHLTGSGTGRHMKTCTHMPLLLW